MPRWYAVAFFISIGALASPAFAQSAPVAQASAPAAMPAATLPAPVVATAPPAASRPAATPSSFDMYDGQWHVDVAPYVWLPRINGTLNVPPVLNSDGSIAIGAGPGSYLKSVNAGSLLTAVARHGNFALRGDFVYLNLSQSTVNAKTIATPLGPITATVQTQAHLTQTIFTGAASYTVAHQGDSNLDLMLGFRYFGVGGGLGVQAYPGAPLPSLSASSTKTSSGVNAVAGIAGNVGLGGHWFIPYYIDAGTGSANFTWMGWTGIGYGSPSHGVVLGYKNIYYNHNGQGLLDNTLNMGGPALGYIFRF